MKQAKARKRRKGDVAIRIKATPEEVAKGLFRAADLEAGIKSPFTAPTDANSTARLAEHPLTADD